WFGGLGGAVSTLGGSAATFSATTFTGNRALVGVAAPGRDGAVAGGGAINNSFSLLTDGLEAATGTLTVDPGTLTENEALAGAGGCSTSNSTAGAGGIGYAGAVANDIGGTVTISDSTFTRNRAVGGAGGNATGKAPGGVGGNSVAGAVNSQRGH